MQNESHLGLVWILVLGLTNQTKALSYRPTVLLNRVESDGPDSTQLNQTVGQSDSAIKLQGA